MARALSVRDVTKIISFGFFIILASIVIGLGVALFPLGFLARFSIIAIVSAVLFFGWALQRDDQWGALPLLRWLLLLVVVLSVLWPRYLFVHKAGLPGVNPLTILTMVALFGCAFGVAYSRMFGREVLSIFQSGGAALMLFFAWFLWRVFASMLGEEPVYSSVELVKEIVYVGSFSIFGLVIAAWEPGPRYLLRVLVGCGLIVSVIGVYEGFAQKNPFIGFISMDGDVAAPRALIAIAAEKLRDGAFRAQSTFDHPIVFAQFVAALVPLALFVAMHDSSRFWRLMAFVALPCALLAIAKSGSRSGYVSVATAFALVAFLWWLRAILYGRFSKAVAIVLLPAMVGAAILAWFFLSELVVGRNQHEISSTSVRLLMLRDGIRALWESPLWGFGHGLSVVKAGVVNPMGLATIDNYLLSMAVDYGYVGLLLFLLGVGLFSARALLFSVRSKGVSGEYVGACLAAVVALVVTFAGVSIYQNMTLFWLILTSAVPVVSGRPVFRGG